MGFPTNPELSGFRTIRQPTFDYQPPTPTATRRGGRFNDAGGGSNGHILARRVWEAPAGCAGAVGVPAPADGGAGDNAPPSAGAGCAIPVEGVSVRQIGELVLPEDPCASVEALCRVAREKRAKVLAAELPASVAASWARSEALGGLPHGAPMLLLPVARARRGSDRGAGYEFAGWYCV